MGSALKKKTMKEIAVVICVFIGNVFGANPYAPPPPPAYAPAPYAPKPVYHPEPHYEEKVPPKPFVYEYGGVDYNGQGFHKVESQDEYGAVNGEYRVELPDGRTQIVTYHADHEGGFVADVKYEGEAKPYVPEPYKPAPYKPDPYKPAPYARAPYTQ